MCSHNTYVLLLMPSNSVFTLLVVAGAAPPCACLTPAPVPLQVPFRLLKNFHKIQQRLVRELEKKFSGKDVVVVANRRIMPPPTSGKSNARPRSRTLTAVGCAGHWFSGRGRGAVWGSAGLGFTVVAAAAAAAALDRMMLMQLRQQQLRQARPQQQLQCSKWQQQEQLPGCIMLTGRPPLQAAPQIQPYSLCCSLSAPSGLHVFAEDCVAPALCLVCQQLNMCCASLLCAVSVPPGARRHPG